MKRKCLSLFLVLAFMVSLLPAAYAAPAKFSDTDGHWAESAIDRWSDYGVLEGDNGRFMPGKDMTRAEMAALLVRLLGLQDRAENTFRDLDEGAWYADAVLKCAAAGILQGADGKANPNGKITRQEAAVMLARALQIRPVTGDGIFEDSSSVADWAAGYVNALARKDIVSGVGANLFAPLRNIDRASVTQILDNAISAYSNQNGETLEARKDGITLVAADNVTVTGAADDVLIAAGAEGGRVRLSGAAVSGTLRVNAREATVTLGNVSVQNAVVEEAAERSKIVVEKTAAVDTLQVSAESTKISVSGKVETIVVADTAAGTSVEANRGAAITTVDNAAENVSVSGSGKVESVTTSGNNTSVDTKGTKVEAAEGTTGTTAGSKDVAGGQSVTTPKPSTGGSSSHSHSYAYADNGNGTHTGTCSCGAAVTAAHNTDGAEGSCSVCGAKVPEDAVASIVSTSGITYYTTLKEALKAAAGGTVTLLADTNIANADLQAAISGNSLCIDLNEKTLTLDDSNSIKLQKEGDAVTDLTFQNGSISANAFKNPNDAVFHILSGCSITLDKVTVETGASVLYPSGDAASVTVQNGSQIHTRGTYAVATNAGKEENYNVVITLKDSSLSARVPNFNFGCAVLLNVPGTLNIENCTIESDMQGVFARAGTVSIKDSTLETKGTYSSTKYGDSSVCWKDSAWGSGDCAPVAALTMGSYVKSGGGPSAYRADAVVTLDNVTFVAPKNISTIYIDSNDTYAARLNGVPESQLNLIVYGRNQNNIYINGKKHFANSQDAFVNYDFSAMTEANILAAFDPAPDDPAKSANLSVDENGNVVIEKEAAWFSQEVDWSKKYAIEFTVDTSAMAEGEKIAFDCGETQYWASVGSNLERFGFSKSDTPIAVKYVLAKGADEKVTVTRFVNGVESGSAVSGGAVTTGSIYWDVYAQNYASDRTSAQKAKLLTFTAYSF